MADVNANIGVHIDTSAALAELKNLQRQLATFHSSVARNSAASSAAQKNLQTNLLNSINATGKFSAQMGLVRTSTESFTHALEGNKLSMREYFRYAGGSTKSFGKLFKQEFDTIGKVAEERVKKMQTQYIKMGRDSSGAMRAMAITPRTLDMSDYNTKMAMSSQKQALFNQLIRQGSTNLLNFGKNTQWAGRQLMVGFTVPLAYFGTAAAKTFMDLEVQAVKFKRVYGDMFTTTEQTNKALDDIKQLAEEFTKYGVAAVKTMELAAQAAAMGKTGADLTAQVAEANRLAVLGGVEQSQALETTISLTNAFGIASEDLAKKINFLNAVENQTVVSIEDLTIAVPKAGPVVKQLGGDVEDLAFFLTAMKEGGINASEGANALKSGLAALINPTKKASDMFAEFGINIKGIVEGNQGNIRQTVIDFSKALDTLDPLNRARAIEQLFGKFQFSRLSTLFQNVIKDGTQASRVLDLAGSSIEQLAILSERELKTVEDSVGVQFKSAVEELKLAIAPIGKTFLEAVTPIVKVIGNVLDKFNNLGEGTKKFIVIASTLVGIIGPTLLMTFGLLANGTANIIKMFLALRVGFLKLGGNSKILAQQTDYLNTEQMEAATVAASLNQAHTRLTQSFTAESSAVRLLRQAYIDATVAAANFARANPGMMMPGRKGAVPKKFAKGTPYVPGSGNKDTVASMLTPGEAVIPKDIAQNPQFQPLIEALVSGSIQKFEGGTVNVGGRSFTTKSQDTGLRLEKKIAELRSKGYTEEKILWGLERNVEQGRPMTGSQLQRRLSIGRGPGSGTSAPREIRLLAQQSKPGFMQEVSAIKEVLKRQGVVMTPAQENNLFNVQASHIEEVRNLGVKEWKTKNLVSDLGYVNNYLNTVKGKLGSSLLGMTPDQLKSMGIDINELKKLQSGTHPTNARAAETLRSVARYDASINPNSYQAKAVLAGLEYRSKNGFYSQPLKTLADVTPLKKTKSVSKKLETKSGVVTGRTGRAKPASVGVVGGAPSDRRQVAVGRGETILNKKTTTALRSGRSAFIPGFGKIRIAGAEDGIPTGQKTGSTTVGTVSQSAQLSRAQLVAATEKISLKEAKRRIAAEGKLTSAMNDSTKAQITTKQKLTEFSSNASKGIGAVSGLTIAASFAGGKVGEMAQQIMPFVFGLQGIAMLLPLLANPWVAAVAAIALVGGTLYKLNKDVENARKEGINLAKAMSMTSKKLVDLSVISGTVSASEAAQRKRSNLLSGTVDAQRQYGQNVLESDFGKGLLADIGTQEKVGKTPKEIAQNMANQLAMAVSQGVVTTAQAQSISSALGEKLGSYEIPAMISGKLVILLGPNGENILKDPLGISLKIKEESVKNLKTAFDQAQNNKKSSVNGLVTAQRVGGAALIAAAVGAAATGVGAPAAIALGVAGSAQILESYYDQYKIKAHNAKLDSATLQLGLEAITQNQQLVDGLNQQYDSKIKNAKTEQEILDIEKQRKISLDQLNVANKTTLNDVISLSSKISPENFNKAINSSVDSLYENASDAVKVFKDIAEQELNNFANSDLKKVIQIGFASGDLDPNTVIQMLDLSKKNPEIEQKIKFIVDKSGFADAATVFQLLFQTGADANTINIMLKYINTNKVDLKTDIEALDILAKFQPTYGVTLDLKTNGAEQLALANSALSKIATLPKTINKTVVQQLAGANPELFKDALLNFTLLSEGKDLISKTLLVNYLVGKEDPALIAAAKTAGLSVPEYIARGFNAASTASTTGTGGNTPKNPKARDTTLDDILNRLKMVRKASINATGGINELLKVTKGKGLTQFGGVMQNLMNQAPGAMNTEFLDFLSQMDDKIRKIYMTIKNGKATLTPKGKALKTAFDEAAIGEYQITQAKTIETTRAQGKAFKKLTAAGVSAAQAIEMVSDAELAVAINGKDIDSDELLKMARNAKTAAQAVKDLQQNLNMQTREGQFSIFKESFSQATDYFDAQGALVQQEREASPVFKDLNTQIDAQTAAIDAAEKVMSDYQSKIGELQYDLEYNTIYGSRIIDNLNSQVDILTRSAEINFDRPLANLNDESSILSNTLGLIDKAEEGINAKFDAQEEALTKISQLNSEIAAQEKQRLTLADALSQGDISAAAAVAQEMRATSAEAASSRSSGTLAAARQSEIGAATVSGMTRVQIEERQFQIGQQTFALEQQRQVVEAQILAIQDQVYAKELLREPINKKIRDYQFEIDKVQHDSLVPSQQLLEKATLARDQYEKQTTALISSLIYQGQTKDQWIVINTELTAVESKYKSIEEETSKSAQNTAAILASWQELKNKTITLTENVNRIITTTNMVNTSYTSSGTPAKPAGKMYGGKIMPMNYGGMVPNYMAVGGRVGSDSVPSMLTPGEFVMNKAATKRFGPMLENMNNSKFPSMIKDMTPAVYSSNNSSVVAPTITSVATTVSDNSSTMYNYNIGITVPQSSASSNDIARAVIGQIKYIDSQRIRGQK